MTRPHDTVVKAAYSRRKVEGAGRAQAAMTYYCQRPTEQGEAIERTAFDRANDNLGSDEVRAVIQEAEGRYDYRLILSPAPGTGGEWAEAEWREWTRDVIGRLEERVGYLDWAAVHHEDSAHPHVHVWLNSDDKLTRSDLNELRQEGDLSAQHLQERSAHLETAFADEQPVLQRQLEQTQIGTEWS